MKLVFTENPLTICNQHLDERKYIPEGTEVVITKFDPEGDNTQFFKDIEDADIIVNGYVYFDKEKIDALKKCKVISFQSTGYNEVDLDYAAEKGIAVASILDYCTQETAENAIAKMMNLQRRTLIYNRSVQVDKVWDPYIYANPQRIEGQTMSVIGLGRIGRHVARIAGKGLGMKILAYDPFIPKELADEVDATLVDFDTALAEADVVSIHMNLTDDNVHMFNKEAFKKMKKRPYVINEGRGPMISEVDLAWALDEGLVRGAGIDMLESEAPDAEYITNCPLINRDNVIINPHSGYLSDKSMDLIAEISITNGIACYEGRYKECWVVRNGVGLD